MLFYKYVFCIYFYCCSNLLLLNRLNVFWLTKNAALLFLIFLLMKPLHFQFGLLYLYPVNKGVFSLRISPCLIIRGGFHAFFQAFVFPDCAQVSLPWVLHLWARVEWKQESFYTVIHSSCSSDIVLLKSRPLMPWTIQHFKVELLKQSLFFFLYSCGIWILSTLLQEVLCRCSWN